MPDCSSHASQGTFEFHRNDLNQAQAGQTVQTEPLTFCRPKAKKRKKMSAEGRERVRQAQIKAGRSEQAPSPLPSLSKSKKKAEKAAA